jgi:hypothetical protein
MGSIYRAQKVADPNFKFTEGFIQSELSHFFTPNAVKYDIDGLYVFDWESDKLLETKSGYIYEFEIKVSRTDFKNDFKNKKDKHIILEGEEAYGDKYIPKYYKFLEESEKHGKWAIESFHKYSDNNPYYLVAGHKRPNYFYYAVPENLIKEEEVPSYAGLVYVDQWGNLTTIKKAPCLHKEKYSDVDLKFSEKFYYNMVKWRHESGRAWRECKQYKDKLNKEIATKGQSMAYKELEDKYNLLKEENRNLVEDSQKSADALHKDLHYQNRMVSRLIREIQKYKPDFNYFEFVRDKLGDQT